MNNQSNPAEICERPMSGLIIQDLARMQDLFRSVLFECVQSEPDQEHQVQDDDDPTLGVHQAGGLGEQQDGGADQVVHE